MKTDLYQKWEPAIDAATFVSAGAFFQPSLPILLISGANALSIAGVKKLLSFGEVESKLLKTAALAAALAVTTFSAPLVCAAVGTHSFILLSGAAQLLALQLVTKLVLYGLYRTGGYMYDYFTYKLPKEIPPAKIANFPWMKLLTGAAVLGSLYTLWQKSQATPIPKLVISKTIEVVHKVVQQPNFSVAEPIKEIASAAFKETVIPSSYNINYLALLGLGVVGVGSLFTAYSLLNKKEKPAQGNAQAPPQSLHLDPIKEEQPLVQNVVSVDAEPVQSAPLVLHEVTIETEEVKVEVEGEEPRWSDFAKYVDVHCNGFNIGEAKKLATKGMVLIQNLMKGEHLEVTNLEQQLREACWGLMLHAINKNQPFVEGTFDIEDPDHRIFNFFFPALYGRKSTHYEKRTIPIEGGKWQGWQHFGADLYNLPASKRTVMLGRIETRDGSHRTYLKMENWGANLNFGSDTKAIYNIHQPILHGVETVPSVAKRTLPWIFGEPGGGVYDKKEHLREADQKQIKSLIGKIAIECPNVQVPKEKDYLEWGFQDIVPFFRTVVEKENLPRDLSWEIQDYVNSVAARYGGNPYQKGDEVSVDCKSFCLTNPLIDTSLERSFQLISSDNE